MPKIVSMRPVTSIKPGTPPNIAPDGTILNPVPYRAVDVEFDDGVTVQVERPINPSKIKTAYLAHDDVKSVTYDGVSKGDVV